MFQRNLQGVFRRLPQWLALSMLAPAALAAVPNLQQARHWEESTEEGIIPKREETYFSKGSRQGQRPKTVCMRSDEFLIHLEGEFSPAQARLTELGLEVVDRYPFSPVFAVRAPGLDVHSYGRLLSSLKRLGRELDFTVSRQYLARPTALPDDPGYSSLQDDLDLIDAPEAWDLSTGDGSVVVAIIDSGMDMDHEDLAGNLFVNPFEIPENGIDDDANGLIDDVNGWDFDQDDNDPEDLQGHGSAMAGIIGAVGNNATGIAGTVWDCQLLPLRAGNDVLPWSSIIQAMDYAIWLKSCGVPIAAINNSYGGPVSDPSELNLLSAAVGRVEQAGILFVAAAGNNGQDNDAGQHFYPSDLTNANILSVAATTNDDQLSDQSNYGGTSVDVAAPGTSIYSTYKDNQYAAFTGTSNSCARVSGMAALLHSLNGNLDYAQLKALIIDNAVLSADLVGKLVNPVRVSLGASGLAARIFPNGDWQGDPYELALETGEPALLEVMAVDFDGSVSSVEFLLDGVTVETDDDGSDGWGWNWAIPVGSGTLQFRITDDEGNSVLSNPRDFTVLSAFNFWRHGYWGKAFNLLAGAAAGADSDSDGLSTIWEYAINGHPLKVEGLGEGSGRPNTRMIEASGDQFLVYELRLRNSDPSLELYLERSGPGLGGPWVETSADHIEATTDPEFTDFLQMTLGIQRPPGSDPVFMRLGVRFSP